MKNNNLAIKKKTFILQIMFSMLLGVLVYSNQEFVPQVFKEHIEKISQHLPPVEELTQHIPQELKDNFEKLNL